jgi:hypothetical protein
MTKADKQMIIERHARGKETQLIEAYIADGPSTLRGKKGFCDESWQIVFDYLVFSHGLLQKCVTQSIEFFVDAYVKHGSVHVREILAIEDDKYDDEWRRVFEFLAIANDGLYYHAMEHRDRYMLAFKARGGDFVRKVLGIWDEKYDKSWEKILDILLHAVCDAIYTENTFEEGVKSFTKMFNGSREQRKLNKSEIFSKGLV